MSIIPLLKKAYNKYTAMNAFSIKLFAIILMVIDHIGLFFFPQYFVFRVVGRLSFPLFAWLIANGAYHTHNIKAYIIRIVVFALVAQIPFLMANRLIDPTFTMLNVLFTLGLGLGAIFVIKKTKNKLMWVLATAAMAGLAHYCNTDYGFFGVLSVAAFYLTFKSFPLTFLTQSCIYLFPFFFLTGYKTHFIEPFALFSLSFIFWYNKQEGPKAKYLFYVFYPLQYVVFYFLLLAR
jgi:hypothetical protein